MTAVRNRIVFLNHFNFETGIGHVENVNCLLLFSEISIG